MFVFLRRLLIIGFFEEDLGVFDNAMIDPNCSVRLFMESRVDCVANPQGLGPDKDITFGGEPF